MNTLASPAQPEVESSVRASRRVYQILRERIVDMDLMPGARIVEKDIAQ
jgi:DNA-binding GntR family transcriptional regulator